MIENGVIDDPGASSIEVVRSIAHGTHALHFRVINFVRKTLLIMSPHHFLVRCIHVHDPASRIQLCVYFRVFIGHCGGPRLRRLSTHFSPEFRPQKPHSHELSSELTVSNVRDFVSTVRS